MKKYPLSLFLTLLFVSCGGGNTIPQQKFGGLKGDIIRTKDYQYTATERFGEPVADRLERVIVTEYDESGNCIKHGEYYPGGDVYSRTESTYENGVVVSEIEQFLDDVTIKRVIERKNNYVKWLIDEGTPDERFSESFYSGLTLTNKNEDGVILSELIYDKKGNIIENRLYNSGKLGIRLKQEFDNNGNIIKQVQTMEPNTSVAFTTSFVYTKFDKNGNWITQVAFFRDKLDKIVKREITYRQ